MKASTAANLFAISAAIMLPLPIFTGFEVAWTIFPFWVAAGVLLMVSIDWNR